MQNSASNRQGGAPARPERSKHKKGRPLRRALIALLLLGALLTGWMLFEAGAVRLMRDELLLDDLPEAFDGATILFMSDIHLDFYHSPERTSAMLHRLAEELGPDMIVLGGDYTTYGLDLILRDVLRRGTQQAHKRIEADRRDRLFASLADLSAPLGTYAVVGNHDNALGGLEQAIKPSGFTLLRNKAVRVERDGEMLCVVGLDDWLTGNTAVYHKLADAIDTCECAIVISHNPDALPRVASIPGRDGERWADLMLSGHTHGGQIRPFGSLIFTSSAYGRSFLTGWTSEGGTKLLTSNGVGSLFLPLRLGAPAQAHLITLRRPAEPRQMEDAQSPM